jgi:hypothetical protein
MALETLVVVVSVVVLVVVGHLGRAISEGRGKDKSEAQCTRCELLAIIDPIERTPNRIASDVFAGCFQLF